MMRFSLACLALVSTTSLLAAQRPTYPGSEYQQQLNEASNLSFSVVNEIAEEIRYIRGAGSEAPTAGCRFCDEHGVSENDGDVIQHLERISHNSQQIGEMTLSASQKQPGTALFELQQACQVVKVTLANIPAARDTVFWEPVGVAKPTIFDSTQFKLSRIQSLIPNCF